MPSHSCVCPIQYPGDSVILATPLHIPLQKHEGYSICNSKVTSHVCSCRNNKWWSFPSLVPRPPHSFCRLQYEKCGRSGISYHVNDVEGRERAERLQLNVGETLATCPRKVESSSRSSTRFIDDREQSHFWESLRRVSVERSIKAWEGVFTLLLTAVHIPYLY